MSKSKSRAERTAEERTHAERTAAEREPDVSPESGTAPGSSPDDAPDGDVSADQVEDDLTRAQTEAAEHLANLQRARADYSNLRRRTLQDIQAAVGRAEGALLTELLQVLDWLDMALACEAESADAKTLHQGVQMTRDQVAGVLARFDLTEIDASGSFDPALHQAFSTVERGDLEPGTIVSVMRKGWKRNGDVLRHAQVAVSAAPAEVDAEVADGGSSPEGPDGSEDA